jgi:sulfur-oxidizing protein SoxY
VAQWCFNLTSFNLESSLDSRRRDLIRVTSALSLAFGSGLLTPAQVFGASRWGSDWNGAVYSARSLEAFVRAMQGDTTTPNEPRTVTRSERGKVAGLSEAVDGQLLIDAPELAENGTNVPVTVRSNIPQTDFIALIADLNPYPVCVGFNVLPENDPSFSVRIKVAKSSNLVAVSRANDRFYYALRDITVMIGGCLG